MRKRLATKPTYELQAIAYPDGKCKRLCDPKIKELTITQTHKKQ